MGPPFSSVTGLMLGTRLAWKTDNDSDGDGDKMVILMEGASR